MDDLKMFRKTIIDLPPEFRPPVDELPGDLQRIGEALEECIPGYGTRLTLIIAQIFQGQHVYFRNPSRFITAWRDARMRAAYDQGNITAKELATLTGLSTRQVECILSRPPEQKELKDKQMRLF